MGMQEQKGITQNVMMGFDSPVDRTRLELMYQFPLSINPNAVVDLEQFCGGPARVFKAAMMLAAGRFCCTSPIMMGCADYVLDGPVDAPGYRARISYVLNNENMSAGLKAYKAPVLTTTQQVIDQGIVFKLDPETNGNYLAAALAFGREVAPLYLYPGQAQHWANITGERAKTIEVPQKSIELITALSQHPETEFDLTVAKGRIKNENPMFEPVRRMADQGYLQTFNGGSLAVLNPEYRSLIEELALRIRGFNETKEGLLSDPALLERQINFAQNRGYPYFADSRLTAFRNAVNFYNALSS